MLYRCTSAGKCRFLGVLRIVEYLDACFGRSTIPADLHVRPQVTIHRQLTSPGHWSSYLVEALVNRIFLVSSAAVTLHATTTSKRPNCWTFWPAQNPTITSGAQAGASEQDESTTEDTESTARSSAATKSRNLVPQPPALPGDWWDLQSTRGFGMVHPPAEPGADGEVCQEKQLSRLPLVPRREPGNQMKSTTTQGVFDLRKSNAASRHNTA